MSTPARTYFPVSSGLLTPKHYEAIGPAWFLFMWMIHEERKPKKRDGEEKVRDEDKGLICEGRVMSYLDISRALDGALSERTVENHAIRLEDKHYIRSKYRGHGKQYWIENPIRWLMVGSHELGNQAPQNKGDSHNLGNQTPTNQGTRLPKVGDVNKEQELQELNTKREREAHPLPHKFEPTPKHLRLARDRGFEITEDCIEEFRDYNDGKLLTLPQWNGLFSGFLRNPRRRATDLPHMIGGNGHNGNGQRKPNHTERLSASEERSQRSPSTILDGFAKNARRSDSSVQSELKDHLRLGSGRRL